MKDRITDLDAAKGLAIVLVVLGHVVAREPPIGNGWYVCLKALIYEFHMPFFMFISGAVFQASYSPVHSLRELGSQVRRRGVRLLVPFFAFALLIWGGKALVDGHLHVDNARGGGLAALATIVLRPSESVATSLWYVYVLFQLNLLFSLGLMVFRGRLVPLVFLAAIAHVAALRFHLPALFAADLVAEHAVFFAAGIGFLRCREQVVAFATANALALHAAFAASFLSVLLVSFHKSVIGAASLLSVYAFVRSLAGTNDRRILLKLGEYSLSIYLMNTILIGVAKGLMLKVTTWDHLNFLVFFPILFCVGLLGPIAIHRYVLARVPLVGRLTK